MVGRGWRQGAQGRGQMVFWSQMESLGPIHGRGEGRHGRLPGGWPGEQTRWWSHESRGLGH